MTDPLLTLDHVSREFSTRRGRITAVDDVSLAIGRGDILCLVGESGSGKTTVARMAAGLLEPTRGTVRFEGRDLHQASKDEHKAYRRAVQLVHQDPYASLNPVRTIGDTLRAPLLHHKLVRGRREATAAGGRAADPGRSHPAAELSEQVPASAQRRSAPARGRGAGAGAQPAADHRRRGGLDGRRLDPGQHPQHDAQAAQRARRRLPLHHPRSGGGEVLRLGGLRRRHVRRQAGRVRPHPADHRPAAPSLREGAGGGDSRSRSRSDAQQGQAPTAQPGHPEPDGLAERLRLPPSLSLFRGRSLRRGRAAVGRRWRRPRSRLPRRRRMRERGKEAAA